MGAVIWRACEALDRNATIKARYLPADTAATAENNLQAIGYRLLDKLKNKPAEDCQTQCSGSIQVSEFLKLNYCCMQPVQEGTTLVAHGPFSPWPTSNSTAWPSFSVA